MTYFSKKFGQTPKNFKNNLIIFLVVTQIFSFLPVFQYVLPINQALAAPGVPLLVNFQGRLTQVSDGSNVANGSYAIEFKLYDDPTAGSLLWTETRDQVAGACIKPVVTAGVFNVKLGSCATLSGVDFTDDALYLTVNFAPTGTSYDGEMAPRKQLTAAPYALNANSVVGTGKIDITNTTSPQATLNYDASNKLTIGVSSAGLTTFTVSGSNEGLNINGGPVGIGITGIAEALLEVQGTGDASLALDADNGDDLTDTWFIKSLASDNALSLENDGTQVAALTPTGDFQIDGNLTISGTAGGGTQCLQVNNTGVVSGTTTACGTATPTLQSAYNNDADSANALITTNGTDGDLVVQTIAGTSFQIQQITSAPTEDIVAITNSGLGTVTTGVDGLSVDFVAADDADATDTNAALNLSVTSSSGDADTLYGLNIANITAGAANEYALNIGTGWDRGLNITSSAASQAIVIDAATTDTTNTNGSVQITLDSATDAAEGLNIDVENNSTAGAGTTIVRGINITPNISAAGGGGTHEVVGIGIQAAAGTAGAGTQNVYGMRIANQGGAASDETTYGLYVDAQSGGGTASYSAIFAGGNVGIGSTAPSLGQLQVTDTAAANSFRGIAVSQHNNGVHGALINTYKSRGTAGSPTTIVNGDYSGVYSFQNHDGTAYRTNSMWGYRSAGTIGTNSIPGYLFFGVSQTHDNDPFTNGSVRMVIGSNGLIGIGSTTPDAKLELAGNITQAAWGLNGIQLQNTAATYTDSSTAGAGTATNAVINSFAQPTLAATNTTVTTTNAANVYIENAPAAGTNQTLTNSYALWVDAGTTRLDGTLNLSSLTGSTQCLTVDTNGDVSGTGSPCGSSGSQTPWTSDIDADGFDLVDLSDLKFRETTGGLAGSDVGFYRDNSGDLTGNVLTGKDFNIAINGTDEYAFNSTTAAFGNNSITNLGSNVTAAAGLVINTTSGDLDLQANGNVLLQPASTGDTIVTIDNDSNFQVNGSISENGSAAIINLTLADDANNDTVNGIAVNATSANTGDTDTLYGINLLLSSADSNVIEAAIHTGSTWEYAALFEGGNVGIHTQTPTQPLHVVGNTDGAAIGPIFVQSTGGSNIGTAITLDAQDNTGGHIYSFISTGTGAGGGAGRFAVYDGTPGTDKYRMIIGTQGYLGLGSEDTTPNSSIELLENLGTDTQIAITNTGGGDAVIGFGSVDDTNKYTIGLDTADNKFKIGSTAVGTSSAYTLDLGTAATEAHRFNGIATTLADGATAEYATFSSYPPTITLGGATTVTGQMDSHYFDHPTITRGGATTVNNATTMTINGPPVEAGSVVLTNAYGLKIDAGASTPATNAFGLYVTSPAGASNNYAAAFMSGNVGIGTAAPAMTLDVNGNILVEGTNSQYWGGQSDTGVNGGRQFYNTAAGGILFDARVDAATKGFVWRTDTSTAGTERMRLNAVGQLGIGTSSQDARLEITGGQSQAAWGLNGILLQASDASFADTTSSGTVTNVVVSSFNTPTLTASSSTTYTNAANLYVSAAPTAGSNVTITNGYAFWVDAGTARFDGNVGIGIAAPTALLHVQQAADLTTTANPVAFNVDSAGATGELTASSGVQTFAQFAPVVNQSSTAGYTALKINTSQTATGSGDKKLLDLQVGGTSKIVGYNGTTTASGATAIAGLFTDTTLTNGTASGFQFGNRHLNTVNGSTAGTEVGTFIRMTDSTSLANTVRGLEVQAWSGTNTTGVNTGIAAFGKTFGLQGTTDALASGTSQAAAIFADLDNGSAPTAGNAIRAYTDNATSAALTQFYQETSSYTGTGLLMNFANGGGSSTGNFIDLQKAGTSRFNIDDTGAIAILNIPDSDNEIAIDLDTEESTAGQDIIRLVTDVTSNDSEKFRVEASGAIFASFISTGTAAVCHATNGTTAVSDEIVDCAGSVNADFAEMYPVAKDVEVGDVVSLSNKSVNSYEQIDGAVNWNKVKGKVSELAKSKIAYDSKIVGIVSDNSSDFASTGYNIKEESNPKPIALKGRVPVKATNENGAIEVGDYLTASATKPGFAMKATKAGMVIGQAIEKLSETTPERVMTFVNLMEWNGPVKMEELLANISLDAKASDILQALKAEDLLANDALFARIAAQEVIAPNIIAGKLSVNSLTFTDDSGLELGNAMILKGGLKVDKISSLKDLISFENDVEFSGKVFVNKDTAGFARIHAKQNKVEVKFENPFPVQPIVTASMTFEKDDNSAKDNDVIFMNVFNNLQYVIVDKNEEGFTIVLNKKAPQDIMFSWTAFAVKEATTFEKEMTKAELDKANKEIEREEQEQTQEEEEQEVTETTNSNGEPKDAQQLKNEQQAKAKKKTPAKKVESKPTPKPTTPANSSTTKEEKPVVKEETKKVEETKKTETKETTKQTIETKPTQTQTKPDTIKTNTTK